MIRHIVMMTLKDDHDAGELSAIMMGLSALMPGIEGFEGFEHGPNRDLEQKSPDFPYGFICTFNDVAALEAYAQNPDHQALGARLVAQCKGGADGIMVIDLDV